MGRKKKTGDEELRLLLELEDATQTEAMLATCRQQLATVGECPDYPNEAGVQAAATDLSARVADLTKTLTEIANLRALLASLLTQRGSDVFALRLSHTGLETALNLAAKGKRVAILSWGGKVATRTASLPNHEPPTAVAAKNVLKTPGAVLFKCKAERRAACYVFQCGTDPTNPDAWAPPVVETTAKHQVEGLTLGQQLWGRIAVVRRRSGIGQWSDIVAITVR